MVDPVTLRMTSRSSKARGLGTSAVMHRVSLKYSFVYVLVDWRILTNFHAVLAHPDESLHLLTRRICILLTVAARIGHVLLGGCVAMMTQCFLKQICSLRHSHIVQMREVFGSIGCFDECKYQNG